MKKNILLLIYISLLNINVFSQSTVISNNKTIVGWALNENKIKVDGNLNETVWQNPLKCGYDSEKDEFPINTYLDQKINVNDVGTAGSPPSYPDLSLYTSTVTYGVVWDNEYFYLGVSVKDPAVKSVTGTITSRTAAATILYFNMSNIRSFQKDGDGLYDISKSSPIAYNENDLEAVFSYFSQVDTNFSLSKNTLDADGGLSFTEEDYQAKMKPTPNGYHLEVALKWSMLNKNFITPATNQYIDESKKPQNGRYFGFDITNNIPKSDGTTRIAKTQWNMCCANRNWTESLNFGTMLLDGEVEFIITTPSPIINGSTTITLTGFDLNENRTLQNTSFSLNTSLINQATIDTNGVLTPLKNGVLTVIGTFISGATSSLVITINGIPDVEAINLTIENINETMGASKLNTSFSPNGAFTEIGFTVSNPNILFLNTIEGIVTATGFQNGVVSITAYSLENASIKTTKEISISNQIQPANIKILINSDSANYCNEKLENVSILGVSNNKIELKSFFCFENNTLKEIPKEFMEFNFSKSSSVVIGNITDNKVTFTRPAGLFTLTGFYKFNSEVSMDVKARFGSIFSNLTCTKGSNFIISCENTTSMTENTLYKSEFKISPNPSNGEFTILGDNDTNHKIEIFDIYGNLVYKGFKNDKGFSLRKGIYILKIKSESIKIVID